MGGTSIMVSFFEGKEAGSFVPFAGDTLKKQAESLWHMAEDLDDSFDFRAHRGHGHGEERACSP